MNRRDRWKAVCEKWIRRIDPTFTEPVYLLSARQATGVVEMSEICGLTGLGMAGDVRTALERRHEWRGPGFAAVIDLERISRTVELIGVALHEYTHYVESTAAAIPLATSMGRAAYHAVLSKPRDDESMPIRPSSTKRPWDQHGPAFIHLAIHAEHRAWRAGCRAVLADWTYYELPSGWRWRGALGDEPARLAKLPMIEVAKHPWTDTYKQFSDEAVRTAEQSFTERNEP